MLCLAGKCQASLYTTHDHLHKQTNRQTAKNGHATIRLQKSMRSCHRSRTLPGATRVPVRLETRVPPWLVEKIRRASTQGLPWKWAKAGAQDNIVLNFATSEADEISKKRHCSDQSRVKWLSHFMAWVIQVRAHQPPAEASMLLPTLLAALLLNARHVSNGYMKRFVSFATILRCNLFSSAT